MKYPMDLIKSYRAEKISRHALCKALAANQGFDNSVTGYSDESGVYAIYRGHMAKIEKDFIHWQESGRRYTARSFKEMKIKIDIIEMRAAAWKKSY